MRRKDKITDGQRVGIWVPRTTMVLLRAIANVDQVSVSHLVRNYIRAGAERRKNG